MKIERYSLVIHCNSESSREQLYKSDTGQYVDICDIEKAIKEAIEKIKEKTYYFYDYSYAEAISKKDVLEILEGILK
jgi:hypothetical protein